MSAETRPYVVGPDDAPDKYRLRRQVGGGGEAELWEAELTVSGEAERVAVKILRDQHAVNIETWRERWAEQTELLRLMRHPGVVGVHTYFEGARMHLAGETPHEAEGRTHYLVMNWVEGLDLRQWVTENAGDRHAALRHLIQVADVLDWLHEGRATPSGRPVVHGDISPGNVIVNSDGQAVLVDFGLFRMATAQTHPSAGTQGYSAPEILIAGEYSPASDRYAFGAFAYFVLTGQSPPADAETLRLEVAEAIDPGGVADADRLALIFADEPALRPSAGEWIRLLRQHSSTVAPHAAPMPAQAPGQALPPPKPPRLGPIPPVQRPTMWRDPVTARPAVGPAPVRPVGPGPGGPLPLGKAPKRRRRIDSWQWVVGIMAVLLICGFIGLLTVALNSDSDAPYSGDPYYVNNEDGNGERRPDDPPPTGLVPDPSQSVAESDPLVVSGQNFDTFVAAACTTLPSRDFSLVGDYEWVDLVIAMGDDSPSGSTALFTVFLDGEEVASTTVGAGERFDWHLRLREANTLRVEVTKATGGTCGIVDGYLS
ncbi:serine/threonine-protein kinase [Phytomonospora sp. NPDC050363]|uniref:serine/threonine protein kinase n=1 Tax=Phytomonospora sp. NPDC050363 TaxID=3155642 RepID=UPI003400CA25